MTYAYAPEFDAAESLHLRHHGVLFLLELREIGALLVLSHGDAVLLRARPHGDHKRSILQFMPTCTIPF